MLGRTTRGGVALAGLVLSLCATKSSAADRYLRPNQLGYGASESKVARVLSKTNLSGASFRLLRVPSGSVAFTGAVPPSAGAWGTFGFVHPVDFSGLSESGQFRLNLTNTGENSLPFAIGEPVTAAPGYEPIARSLLGFFAVQRCGPTSPQDHGVCHLLDAHHIVGGPNAGQAVNVQGGWHDAGDYIKFSNTVAYSTHLLLWADEIHPNLAGDWNGNGVSDLLDEGKIGARFLLKLRYQPGRFLWQVSDASDHGQGWRLPENDALAPNRPAYYGPGKNQLGRYVAALARAARAYADVAPALADSCRVASLDAYAAMGSAPNFVNGDFYGDNTYHDKVALAAIELYLTTGQASHLSDAKIHADLAGPGYWSGWGTLNGLADALLAPYHAPALADLLTDVQVFQDEADAHPFAMAGTEAWGINLVIAQMAAEALLYERITGVTTYAGLPTAQRDFLLGANPWGVCFIGSVGAVSPQDFHHQVATIQHGGAMPGALAEGPAPASEIQGQGIVLEDPDEYAEFQATRGVYHDDRANYVTNEPSITGNAPMIFLLALFASRGLETVGVENGGNEYAIAGVRAWPNPFRESVTMEVGEGAWVHVGVLDANGRVVVRLQRPSASRSVTWNGLDSGGRRAPLGIYFLSIEGATRGKLVRVR